MAKDTIKTAKTARIIAIVAVIIGILLIATATILLAIESATAPQDPDNSTSAQPDDYTAFTPIDSQGVIDFLSASGATGLLYAGRDTCPNCRAFTPLLAKVTRSGSYKVYFYDTDAANSDPDKKTAALKAINVTGVPAFMYIKDGVVVEKLTDRSSESSIQAFIDKHIK